MKQYHKIQTIFKRDPENNFKTLLDEYSIPEFEYLRGNKWVFTEKVDGTNIRVIFNEDKLEFRGKSDNANMPPMLNSRLNELFNPKIDLFKELFPEGKICLYGEGYGAGIQKGVCYGENQDFVLFDIKVGDWWLQRGDVAEIGNKLGVDIVPTIGEGTLAEMAEKTKQGFNSIWGDFLAEGIVARPETELCTRGGTRIITKIKYKDF